MANSDKNIRITTNNSTSLLPKIVFTGQSNSPIILNVLDDNTLSFEGSSGQLFSINNVLSSGYIFAINDISGIPSFRINADGTVGIAEFTGNVGVGLTNPTFKFQTNGSAGFGASIWSSPSFASSISGVTFNNGTITSTGVLSSTGRLSVQVSDTAALAIKNAGGTSVFNVDTTNGITSVLSSTASTSTTTGALVVTGGVGIGGSLNVNSASSISGVRIDSGILYGNLTGTATTAGFATTANYSNQSGYGLTSGFATTSTYSHQAGYAITSGSTGSATTSTYAHQSGYATTSGLATTATYAYQSGYATTSGLATTATYAYQSGYATTSGLATTATYSIQSGYASTSGSSGSATTANNINVVNATANSAHTLLFSPTVTGSGVAVSSNTTLSYNPSTNVLSTSGLAITSTTASTSTATGALQVAGGVGISGRLSFNQASFGTTGISTNPTMAMIGNTGDPIFMSVLEDNTISFEGSQGQLFSITPNLSTGYIYSVNDITGIPLLRANANANVTANEYAGNFGIGITNPGYKLHVVGSVGFTSTTPSTSSSTGTLVVAGGVGIGGSLYVNSPSNISNVTLNNGVITGNLTGTATTAGFATTSGLATTATYSHQAGYAITASSATTATTATTVSVASAGNSNLAHSVLITNNPSSGSAVSSDSTFSFNPSTEILSVSGLAVTSTTGSSNTTTGALVVTGGVGIGGSLFVNGDLTINGTTTTINSVTLSVDDKNIELGSVGSPSDVTAEGGGITLKGATDKFINWYSGVGWSSSESWNLVSGSTFKINNTNVLSSTTLGTGVTNSSLTSVGTITSGTWAGTTITAHYGGIGLTTPFTVGDLLYANSSTTWARLPASSNSGYVLASAGSGATPVYTSASTITAGSATTAFNINVVLARSNANHSLLFSPSLGTASGAAVSNDSTLVFNPSTEILTVSGLAVTSSAATTSTSSGALTVSGGVGIAGTVNIQGDETVFGRLNYTQSTVGIAGTTVIPSIQFIGQNNNPISLSVLADNTLSFEGSSGQLFSINNNLSSGTIFSVNDISGIPILRANANGTLSLGEFSGSVGVGLSLPSYKFHVNGSSGFGGTVFISGNTFIASSTTSTSTSTGALVVSGGVGIGGSLYVASPSNISNVSLNNGVITGNLTGTATTATYSIQSGYAITAGSSNTSGFATTSGLATTASNINVNAALTNANHYLIFSPNATGAGVALSSESTFVYNPSTDILSVSGLAVTSSLGSNSTTAGALVVTGGVGIGGSVNIGRQLTVSGTARINSSVFNNPPTSSIGASLLQSGYIFGSYWTGFQIENGYLIYGRQVPGGSIIIEEPLTGSQVGGTGNVFAEALQHFKWGNDKYVVLASTGNSVLYSTSPVGAGSSWFYATLPTSASWQKLEYGNNRFIAIATGSTSAYSLDGINWTLSTLPGNYTWSDIKHGNGVFVAGTGSTVAYTYDGIEWTIASNNVASTYITFGNGLFFANSTSNTASYSRDGISWTNTTLPSDTHRASAYGNGVFVNVGNSTTSYFSTDLINWVSGPGGSDGTTPALLYFNNLFYFKENGSGYGKVVTGPTGTLDFSSRYTGEINNVRIGAITPGAAEFTALAAVGPVRFVSGVASTNYKSGSVVISGGVGIGGSLNTSTSFTSSISGINILNGSLSSSTGTIAATNKLRISVSDTSAFVVADGGNSAKLSVDTVAGIVTVSSSTASTSTTTGALVVTGGVGIGGGLYVKPSSLSTKGLVVQANASQTGNLLEFQSSTGSTYTYFTSDGRLRISGVVNHADGSNPKISVYHDNSVGGGILVKGVNTDIFAAIEVHNNPGATVRIFPSGLVEAIKYTGYQFVLNSTGYPGSSEFIMFNSPAGLMQFDPGATVALQRNFNIQGHEIRFSGTASTISKAVVVQLSGANYASTNCTITENIVFRVLTNITTAKGIVVQGATSQTANLFELQNSSSSTITSFNAAGELNISSSTASTSSTTGALIVTGGVGIGQTLFTSASHASSVSGVILNNGTITGTLSGYATTSNNIRVVGAGNSNLAHPVLFTPSSSSSGSAVSSDNTFFFNSFTEILSVSGLAVTASTASTSSTTGALIVTGGVGVGGTITVGFGVSTPVLSAPNNLIIKPGVDSSNAIQFTRSSTAIPVVTFDTLNSRVGIGVTNPEYDLEVNCEISATTKSFLIPHPTKENMKLRYGSLEGPENGVYLRGELRDSNEILLPDYWEKLVDHSTITVHLTPIGNKTVFVKEIKTNKIIVGSRLFQKIHCFYSVWAERKDVPKLKVEF